MLIYFSISLILLSLQYVPTLAAHSSPSVAVNSGGTTTGGSETELNSSLDKILQTWIDSGKVHMEKLKDDQNVKLLAVKRDEILEKVKGHETFQRNKDLIDEMIKRLEEDERFQGLRERAKLALVQAAATSMALATTTMTAAENFVKSEQFQNALKSEGVQKVVQSDAFQQVLRSKPMEIATIKYAELSAKKSTETEGEATNKAT